MPLNERVGMNVQHGHALYAGPAFSPAPSQATVEGTKDEVHANRHENGGVQLAATVVQVDITFDPDRWLIRRYIAPALYEGRQQLLWIRRIFDP